MYPCSDFDLPPLQVFEPELLLGGKNSADALILLLAVAYNDLKDEMWVLQQLKECKRLDTSPGFSTSYWLRLMLPRGVKLDSRNRVSAGSLRLFRRGAGSVERPSRAGDTWRS
jgi:hypothetical protein